jgi:hypothetical protein
MAFPTVATRSSGGTSAANTTSHPITLPSGIVAGDLLLCVFSVDGQPTCSPSAGWAKLGQATQGTAVTGAVFWRHATGADALTVTTSASEQSTHIVLRITGGGIPTGASAAGSSTNSNPPNLADAVTADYLWVATRSADSTNVASAAPASFGNLQSQTASGTGGASTNTAERNLNAASLDPGTFTSTNTTWVSWTIAIPTGTTLPSRTVLDAFDDGAIGVPPWEDWGAPQTAETGGTLRITSTLASGYYGVDWDTANFDINEAYLGTTLVSAGNQALTSFEAYPVLLIWDATNTAYWLISGNVVYVYTQVAGVYTQRASFAYDSAVHRQFVIGESGGNLLWLWSTDGSVWRVAFSLANPFGSTSVRVELLVGTWQAEASTGTVQWDDFTGWGILATHEGAADLSAVASLSAGGTVTTGGAAALTAVASLSAAGTQVAPGAVDLTAVADLGAAGVGTAHGAAALEAVAALDVNAVAGIGAATALTSVAELVAGAGHTAVATAALMAVAELVAGGTLTGVAAADLVAVAELAAAGGHEAVASAALTAVAELATGGLLVAPGSAVLESVASLDAATEGSASGAADLAAVAELVAGGVGVAPGTADLVAVAALGATAVRVVPGGALLSAVAELAVSGQRVAHGAADLDAVATLAAAAEGPVTEIGAAALVAVAGLLAGATRAVHPAVALTAVARLVATVAGGAVPVRGPAVVRAPSGLVVVTSGLGGVARARSAAGEAVVR